MRGIPYSGFDLKGPGSTHSGNLWGSISSFSDFIFSDLVYAAGVILHWRTMFDSHPCFLVGSLRDCRQFGRFLAGGI